VFIHGVSGDELLLILVEELCHVFEFGVHLIDAICNLRLLFLPLRLCIQGQLFMTLSLMGRRSHDTYRVLQGFQVVKVLLYVSLLQFIDNAFDFLMKLAVCPFLKCSLGVLKQRRFFLVKSRVDTERSRLIPLVFISV